MGMNPVQVLIPNPFDRWPGHYHQEQSDWNWDTKLTPTTCGVSAYNETGAYNLGTPLPTQFNSYNHVSPVGQYTWNDLPTEQWPQHLQQQHHVQQQQRQQEYDNLNGSFTSQAQTLTDSETCVNSPIDGQEFVIPPAHSLERHYTPIQTPDQQGSVQNDLATYYHPPQTMVHPPLVLGNPLMIKTEPQSITQTPQFEYHPPMAHSQTPQFEYNPALAHSQLSQFDYHPPMAPYHPPMMDPSMLIGQQAYHPQMPPAFPQEIIYNTAQTSQAPQPARRRERNRIAASKCRARKRNQAGMLKDQTARLAMVNEGLKNDADQLKKEIQYLKSELLQHSRSGCTEVLALLRNNLSGHNIAGGCCSSCKSHS